MRIKKKTRMIISVLLLTVFFGMSFDQTALAYFDRGPVGVSVGKSSVTLEVGQSESVSVSFSPSESSQLPGCGMAECPQICGDKNCLDENGECKCNGLTYQTYYAFAQTSSSNTSVATATYQNGVVLVTGHSAGTATITVTASLRQFQSTSTSFTVTVNQQPQTQKPQTSDTSSSGNNQSGNSQSSDNSSQNTGVAVHPVNGDDSSDEPTDDGLTAMEDPNKEDTDEKETKDSEETEYTTIESDRGPITFVPIQEGKMGKDVLESILGKEAYVDFQKKDDAGTVLYAWEFYGMELTKAEDLSLIIHMSEEPFEGCTYGKGKKAVYLAFDETGDLPGPASVFLKINDYFGSDDNLNLYKYEKDGTLVKAGEDIVPENDYVTLEIEQGGNYILTTEQWDTETAETKEQETETKEKDETSDTSKAETKTSNGSSKGALIAIIVIVCVIVVALVVWSILKKKKTMTDTGAETENEDGEFVKETENDIEANSEEEASEKDSEDEK